MTETETTETEGDVMTDQEFQEYITEANERIDNETPEDTTTTDEDMTDAEFADFIQQAEVDMGVFTKLIPYRKNNWPIK